MGFDVIPTDCMAAVLKEALPDATHHFLAFDAPGPMSLGTARTMVQSLQFGQHGGRVRRNGVIEEVPLAHSWRLNRLRGRSAPSYYYNYAPRNYGSGTVGARSRYGR